MFCDSSLCVSILNTQHTCIRKENSLLISANMVDEKEEKGVALPHVLHPFEKADVISTLNQQSAQTASRREAKSPLNVRWTMSLFFFLYLSHYLYDIRRRGRFMFSSQRQPSGAPASDPVHRSCARELKSFVEGSERTWELSDATVVKHALHAFLRDRTIIRTWLPCPTAFPLCIENTV